MALSLAYTTRKPPSSALQFLAASKASSNVVFYSKVLERFRTFFQVCAEFKAPTSTLKGVDPDVGYETLHHWSPVDLV
jgi:hypothetical protein